MKQSKREKLQGYANYVISPIAYGKKLQYRKKEPEDDLESDLEDHEVLALVYGKKPQYRDEGEER